MPGSIHEIIRRKKIKLFLYGGLSMPGSLIDYRYKNKKQIIMEIHEIEKIIARPLPQSQFVFYDNKLRHLKWILEFK
jgi:hypothetical protein